MLRKNEHRRFGIFMLAKLVIEVNIPMRNCERSVELRNFALSASFKLGSCEMPNSFDADDCVTRISNANSNFPGNLWFSITLQCGSPQFDTVVGSQWALTSVKSSRTSYYSYP